MNNQYVGGGPSRMSLVVTALLVIALMATLLALALATGILEFRGPGGGQAVVSPSPGRTASLPPAATSSPSSEPTESPSPAASPSPSPSAGATAQATPGGIHVVQPGESLFSIGLLYGVPWGEIAAANEITAPELLQVGQELIIPLPASLSPPPNVHIVQAGESITSIAQLYDVSPTDLADANNIEDWDLIFVGQQLIIPGIDGGESPAP
ncbi:MAG TPA: LysM domain-containing protein [Candidatus Limnocylindria bacterium]|nr:LysM domain-containing protein [Candidatus Limnocylindria bacterium]